MNNWIRPAKSNLPAPVSKTLAQRSEFDRKLAEFRIAKGVLETCHIVIGCQNGRDAFALRFERASPGELFKFAGAEKLTPLGAHGPKGHAAPLRKFNTADFDFGKWRCGCGRSGFVHCHCGHNTCHEDKDERAGGVGSCGYCGSSGPLEPLKAIGASSSRNASARSGIAGNSRLLLPRGGSLVPK